MKKIILLLVLALITVNVFALEIKSDVFENKGYIPDRYTCDSKNVSPLLSWSEVPENTKSFVLICDDPDAPFKIWVHWVLFNIEPQVNKLKEEITEEELESLNIVGGLNDFGKVTYQGPCPPSGKAHRYFFKLYALDDMLPLEQGATKKEVIKAMQGHIIAEAKTIGLYQRQIPDETKSDNNQEAVRNGKD
jgi:Raf kinase inhibitor-like YbhB/YbcL family protein